MNTLGLERRDGRNMLIVVAAVAMFVVLVGDGALGVRIAAGLIAGGVSAAVFVVSTLLINRYKPDYW